MSESPRGRHIDDVISEEVARALSPFDPGMVNAARQLTYRMLRDLLFQAFGDHPDYERRIGILYAEISEHGRRAANEGGS